MDENANSKDWTDAELTLIVTDYFRMLGLELAGRAYSKTEHRNALMRVLQRSKGSIEFKHQNVSAVLQDLALPWIDGYKPRANYQASLVSAIEAKLGSNELPEPTSSATKNWKLHSVFVSPPPATLADTISNAHLMRLLRRFDPAERDARNRKLGANGEKFVFEVERTRLSSNGKEHLAKKVTWVSRDHGDGAGYDILSFEMDGSERLLEVKTTYGSIRTPFYISSNELAISNERPENFRLFRVHNFANEPSIAVLAPPLTAHVRLEPHIFRASF